MKVGRSRISNRIDSPIACFEIIPELYRYKLMRLGGVRAVVAESLLLKQQLLISGRARRRAPNPFDRFVFGLASLFIPASRLPNLVVPTAKVQGERSLLVNRKNSPARFAHNDLVGGSSPPGPTTQSDANRRFPVSDE
jgi:hypothetical protein